MLETVLRTEDLLPEERFACWYESAVRSVLPVTVRSEREADFQASLCVRDFGWIQVSRISCPDLDTTRGPKLIRRSDPELYQLYLNLTGTTVLAQADRQASLGPGDLVLFDSSRPYRGTVTPAREHATGSCLIVQFPYARLPLSRDAIDMISSRRLTARAGVAALTTRYLTELAHHAPDYSEADAARLSTVTLDLIAAWLSHELDTPAAPPPPSRQRALQARIHHYIQQHLASSLTPETIAAAHQISVSYLYKLFQDQGLTVADWIRRQRLERCRHDLADPRLESRPIHAIAVRWGFNSKAHFSRAFRTAYGMPPKDYRQLVHHGHGVEGPSTTVQGRSTPS